MDRIMALDIGDRRTGVAISDPLGVTAQGLCVIEAEGARSLVEQVASLASRYKPGKIVVGLPLNLNGTAGERAAKVRRTAEKIRTATGIETVMWDERLTTLEAERVLIEGDVSRSKRKRVVDMTAACLILQGYLQRAGLNRA